MTNLTNMKSVQTAQIFLIITIAALMVFSHSACNKLDDEKKVSGEVIKL